MVHNGIEYGDMQLISEAYDVLKTVGGLTNEELVAAFDKWYILNTQPLSLIPYPLSLIPYPLSFIPYPLSLIP